MKYGMLIVDDEYLVRTGIHETIDWSHINVDIVGEAINGKQGLEAALRLKPDLIFTDIRMPIMDGLEMIEKLAEKKYDGAIIIYSGYQDFEYARKALEYGVDTYLLKPFNNDELVKKVREALEKLEQKRRKSRIVGQFERNLPILKEKLFLDLLTSPLNDELLEQLKIFEIVPPQRGIIIGGEGYGDKVEKVKEDLTQMVKNIFSILSEYQNIDHISESSFIILTSMTDILTLSEEINKLLFDHQRKSNIKLSLQISSVYGKNLAINEAYEEIKTLRRNRLFLAVNTVATSEMETHPYKPLVKDIMKLIAEEYGSKLTVKAVADKLYVSESHLMHEFKENVGKTFNECLTEYRIIKAKELLLKGKYRVNEVAVMVGYNDVKYFGQVFKEMVGMTPSQFLSQMEDEFEN